MARIRYDEQTAAAFKAVREVPRDGLTEWRDAIARHLHALPGMTLLDIGAGTGAFSAAFCDWFGADVLAVEPSAAMRNQIPRLPHIQMFEGSASALPLPDACADAAWLSLVIHHIPDLQIAAREIPDRAKQRDDGIAASPLVLEEARREYRKAALAACRRDVAVCG